MVGIDIPSSPVDHTPSPSDHAHRSSSMRDVREPLHNQKARRGLVYLANEGVVGPEVQVKKHKPRRSHSLNYHSDGRGSGHGSDMDIAGGSNYSPSSPNPAPQYPLRETVSLSQLPGGYAGGSRRIPHGGAAPLIDPHGGSGLDHTSLSKSTSLRSLPSGNTSRHHQFNSDSIHHQFHSHSTSRQGPDRGPSSYGSSRDIKKVRREQGGGGEGERELGGGVQGGPKVTELESEEKGSAGCNVSTSCGLTSLCSL